MTTTLTGSTKQISWAEQIRTRVTDGLEATERSTDKGDGTTELRFTRPSPLGGIASPNAVRVTVATGTTHQQVIDWLLTRESAQWWIDTSKESAAYGSWIDQAGLASGLSSAQTPGRFRVHPGTGTM